MNLQSAQRKDKSDSKLLPRGDLQSPHHRNGQAEDHHVLKQGQRSHALKERCLVPHAVAIEILVVVILDRPALKYIDQQSSQIKAGDKHYKTNGQHTIDSQRAQQPAQEDDDGDLDEGH